MTFQSASGAVAVCLLLAASPLLTACVTPGYYDSGYSSSGASSYSDSGTSSYSDSGTSSSSYSDSSSYGEPRERSFVDRSGNIVFHEPGETTIVRPDGDVTVVQRDRDGTRTIVNSDGTVQVRTPDGNCIGDC